MISQRTLLDGLLSDSKLTSQLQSIRDHIDIAHLPASAQFRHPPAADVQM